MAPKRNNDGQLPPHGPESIQWDIYSGSRNSSVLDVWTRPHMYARICVWRGPALPNQSAEENQLANDIQLGYSALTLL